MMRVAVAALFLVGCYEASGPAGAGAAAGLGEAGEVKDLAAAAADGHVTFVGRTGGTSGDSVAMTDLDGDGLSDVLVADREYRGVGDERQRNAVYVVYGRQHF